MGTAYGPLLFNGQVAACNFYEEGAFEGIELIVAKNSSFFYYNWWLVPSMSQYNYTLLAQGAAGINTSPKYGGYSQDEITTGAYSQLCYALWTTSAESSCLAGASDDDDDDDDDDNGGHALVATAAAFSVVTFLAVLTFGLLADVQAAGAAPLAAQAASSAASAPANEQL